MATTRLVITHASDFSAADVAQKLNTSSANGAKVVKSIASYLEAGVLGVRQFSVSMEQTPVAASQTVVCDQSAAVATTDILTVGGVALASVASGPDVAAGEWLLGASDTAMATNIAAAVNGHTTLGKIVTATSLVDTVTITAITPGTLGNLVTLAEAGNGLTLTGAALAGGDGGETADITTYSFGV